MMSASKWWPIAAVLCGVPYVIARAAGVPAGDVFVLAAAGFVCGMVALYGAIDKPTENGNGLADG